MAENVHVRNAKNWIDKAYGDNPLPDGRDLQFAIAEALVAIAEELHEKNDIQITQGDIDFNQELWKPE